MHFQLRAQILWTHLEAPTNTSIYIDNSSFHFSHFATKKTPALHQRRGPTKCHSTSFVARARLEWLRRESFHIKHWYKCFGTTSGKQQMIVAVRQQALCCVRCRYNQQCTRSVCLYTMQGAIRHALISEELSKVLWLV